MKKAIVLYSGGLDSRLAVKIMLEQGFDVEAVYFSLPFGCNACGVSGAFEYLKKLGVGVRIFDVSRGDLLKEYLEIIKNPRHGIGTGLNPCRDCKIWMFRKAKEYADSVGVELLVTGEVLGQRPMSQVKNSMAIIDKRLGFEILRPLSAKVLSETSFEKSGLVNREKLYDFVGRGRKDQRELAEKLGVDFVGSGGGCFLCEKVASAKVGVLFEHDFINEETLKLVTIGRHFFIDGFWFVVARNGVECSVIDSFESSIIGGKAVPSVYFSSEKGKEKALELQKVYSSGVSEEDRKRFEEWKI